MNWEIIEEDTGVEIRIMTGTFCKRLEEMAAFQEPLARKKRKAAAQKKRSSSAKVFGISDVMKGLKGQKQAIGILSELVATVQKSLEESQNENKTRKKRAEKTSPG
ncbi:MAG: hypothetical protein HY743_08830 [Deltaproteobacteria bacterium]|nr:hypothetical protein [Deltaproteobacteria bacterium]